MQKTLTFFPSMLKSQVAAFTRKDGAFVAAHDSGKQAAAPKMDMANLAAGHHLLDKEGQKVDEVESVEPHPMGGHRVNTRAGYSHMVRKDGTNDHGLTSKAPPGAAPAKKKTAGSSKPLHVQKQEKLDAEKAAAAKPNLHNHLGSGEAKSRTDPYDGHPNIVGKADKTDDGDHPSKAGGMHFLGNQYHATYKDGKSNHDQTPVREFRESNGTADGGQSVWMDHSGRIHADSKSEVPGLRANYEAHMAKSKKKAKLVVRKPAAKPVHSDDAFAQIKAAGGKNVNTSSDGINYTHNGKESTLAHKNADDGHRYVDHGELQSHLGKIKDGGGAKGNLPPEPKKKGPMPFLQ